MDIRSLRAGVIATTARRWQPDLPPSALGFNQGYRLQGRTEKKTWEEKKKKLRALKKQNPNEKYSGRWPNMWWAKKSRNAKHRKSEMVVQKKLVGKALAEEAKKKGRRRRGEEKKSAFPSIDQRQPNLPQSKTEIQHNKAWKQLRDVPWSMALRENPGEIKKPNELSILKGSWKIRAQTKDAYKQKDSRPECDSETTVPPGEKIRDDKGKPHRRSACQGRFIKKQNTDTLK